MECTPWQECPKRIYFHCFWFEFVSKYHKTYGCNLWQPQGSRFTAKFGIGTPPENKSVSDTLQIRHGPRPNRWSAHLGRNVEKESNFFFFWYDLDFKYHKTVGCNFWQPQGSHFTPRSGIGKPPQTKSAFEPLRNRRGPRPNMMEFTPWQECPKRIYFRFFIGLNSCSNTIKQLDATFGSRRGVVLQQNLESAHHLIKKCL